VGFLVTSAMAAMAVTHVLLEAVVALVVPPIHWEAAAVVAVLLTSASLRGDP
jgi:hypothetical protein